MQMIIKKISLEKFKSRMPSSIAAIKKVWQIPSLDDTIYYTYEDALNAAVRHAKRKDSIISYFKYVNFVNDYKESDDGNYGLIVSDIEVTNFNITDYTDIYVNIRTKDNSYEKVCNGNDFYSIKRFSYDDVDTMKEEYVRNKQNYSFEGGLEYYFYIGRDIYYASDISNMNVEDIVDNSINKKYITYSTLLKWNNFFKEYKELLKNDVRQYNSLVERYEVEGNDFGLTLGECEEFDALFIARGGNDFYNYINNKLFLKFHIPTEFVDEWKSKYLMYPSAVNWAGWFKEMHDKYYNINDKLECVDSENCCECKEFFRLGGHEMYSVITQWVDSITGETCSTKSCSAVIPILLERNIEDCGEMSIFSERWKPNVNYSNTLSYDLGTVVISPSGNSMVISEGNGYGFDDEYKEVYFDEDDWKDYTELCMNRSQDEFATEITSFTFNHLDQIIFNPNDEKMEIVRELNTNNGLGYFLINETLFEVQVKHYVIYASNDNSTINGKIFPVEETTNGTYYVNINGRQYFPMCIDGKYYFNFNKDNKCAVKGDYNTPMRESTSMIVYDNMVYLVKYDEERDYEYIVIDNEISKIRYKKINAYFVEDNVTYYIVDENPKIISNGYVLSLYEKIGLNNEIIESYYETTFEEVKDIWIVNNFYPYFDSENVHLLYKYDIHKCSIISGTTESKLSSIRSLKLLTDEQNNTMPGYYDFSPNVEEEKDWVINGMDENSRKNSKNISPYDGMLLDLYYKVGNVSNLSLNENLTNSGNPFKEYYDGNIIDTIKFFYMNTNDDTINKNTLVELSISKDVMVYNPSYDREIDFDKENNLKAIELCKTLREEYIEDEDERNNLSENIYCQIEYYMDSIIHKKVHTARSEYDESILYIFDGYELELNDTKSAIKYHYGIKYVDTVELVENVCTYTLFNGKSYSLRYYDMIYPLSSVNVNEEATEQIKEGKFYMPILLYLYGEEKIEKVHPYYDKGNGFNYRNDLEVFPTFRRDYQVGISVPQNVNSDIYIDRGIHKAFDRHIRLQEINTMEALENYGNDIFKLTEY